MTKQFIMVIVVGFQQKRNKEMVSWHNVVFVTEIRATVPIIPH